MSWKKQNKDYINDSVSLTSSIIIIAISLLIMCLADNI